MERSLKLGVIRNSKFTILFRTEVFRFLFNDKGRDVQRGQGRNYDKEDFNETYFPCNWNRCYDRLGDGCEIDFPVHLIRKVKWSPVVYSKEDGGTLISRPKLFCEILVVTVIKKRC